MVLPIHTSLRETQRFGRVALTALVIGLGGAAVATLPLGNLAFAGNGNGNGGGNGGGHDHGHDGGHGGGGKGGGQGNSGGGQGSNHDGPGSSAKAGKGGGVDIDTSGDDDTTVATTDDSTTTTSTTTSDDSTADDGSLAPGKLGKLNGFFHASPNGLANASPKSSIGRISHTFKDALSDFAEASETLSDPNDPDATPPSGPSVGQLGAILAGATNKQVTATQVKAIIDRLAEQNPDDQSLNHLAGSVDAATCQDIADAANGTTSDETTDDSEDSTDTSSDDSSTDGTADDSTNDGTNASSDDTTTTVVTTATN
jgi:hypothetical protein